MYKFFESSHVGVEQELEEEPLHSLKTSIDQEDPLTRKLYYSTIFHVKYLTVMDWEVGPGGDSIVFTFNMTKGVGKTLESPYFLTKEEARICAHHVTFDIFTQGHKETALREIFGDSTVAAIGNLTPDLHYVNERINIIEFATNRSAEPQALVNTMNTKLAKYSGIIRTMSLRANKVVTYNVIVVGRIGVLSTIPLKNALVSELLFRYRTSLTMVDHCRSAGFMQATDEEIGASKTIRDLKSMFSSMTFNFDEEGEWSEKNYQKWISPLSMEEKSAIHRNFMIVAKQSQLNVEEEFQRRSQDKDVLIYQGRSLIDKHKDELRKCNNTRRDAKPACIFPLVIPKCRTFYKSFDFSKIDINFECNTALETVWHSAVAEAKASGNYEFEEVITNLYDTIISETEETVSNKSSYKRVSINLSESEWAELALKGVGAKRFKDDDNIKMEVIKSKRGFDPDVCVSDIETFVMSRELFEASDGLPGYIHDFNQITERAKELSETLGSKFDIISNRVLNAFMNTRFFRFSCLITEIATELAMSLRQNCKSDQFIIKTLKYHDVILLIKPTTSDGHIFFSLLCIDDTTSYAMDLPFTQMHRQGNMLYTNFVSANAQQLSHWSTCSANALVLFTSWSKQYSLNITELSSMAEVPIQMCQMMNLSLLIFLEQKTSTEEVLTLLRYVSMESFKDHPGFCDTLKVLSKMPTYFRSRLTSWVYNRVTREALNLFGKGYTMISRRRNKTKWTNLRNPYTLEQLEDPGLLVNLYYLGYLRNKHTRTSANQDVALISKIMKGELQYWKAKDKDTLGSCIYDMEKGQNPHNYDVGFMKLLSEELKIGLKKRLGRCEEEDLCDYYLKYISGMSIDTFMTLKASSSFKPGDESLLMGHVEDKIKHLHLLSKRLSKTQSEVLREDLSNEIEDTQRELSVMHVPKARPRVIEEFSEILAKYDPPCLYLKESIDICTKHGMMIDIFKKPQQGGLREIYVVNRETRVVQYCIESLSRIICSEFESETMTHPKNKVNLMTNHGVQANAKFMRLQMSDLANEKIKIINSNSSKDKKSWNNTNSPSKFAILLLRLMPKYMHAFIFNSLKLWDKKNMLIPEGLRNIIIKGRKWDIGDKIMNDFVKAYEEENPLYKSIIHEGKPYITIKTGMMQGILHYTSSLSHTAFNLLMTRQFREKASRCNFIKDSMFTHLESSDDSAYLKTVFINTEQKDSKEQALRFMYTFDHYSSSICDMAGFHESKEKSSWHSSRVVEFNSEFCFDNQVNKPNHKFEFASLRIPENESLSETCYQYKCLSSACLESGTNIIGVHWIQIAQSLIHYTTLGLNLNPYFRDYKQCLVAQTDPGLGFFPLDPCMLAGVVDHQFNVWMLTKGNKVLAAKTTALLETEKMSSYSSGTILKSAVLQFGDRKRWARIVSAVEEKIGQLDYREFVRNHPQLLFLRPQGKEEIIAYHFLKLYTPSIISSLGNIGRMDKMLIRGGYAIQCKCLTLGSLWEELLPSTSKTNLMSLALNTIDISIMKLTQIKKSGLADEELVADLQYLESLKQGFRENKQHEIIQKANISQLGIDSVDDKIMTNHQQRCLFPQFMQYLTVLSCHRSLRNSGHQNWVSHEKKRALVNVYLAPLKDLLSLESLCLMKWFSHNTHVLPTSIVEVEWDRHKLNYHWLRDTFKESFECSNFENEISFANFIKEQSGKNRNLYVTSSPLKIEDGHSALYSLITRHSWPGLLLKAKKTEEILNPISKEIIHPLAVLAGLKMNTRVKQAVFYNTLLKSKVYQGLVNEFMDTPASNQREKRLRPILMAARNVKNTQLYHELLSAKLGIIGNWITPEKYNANTRSYEGYGVWLGRIDNLVLRIETHNSAIRTIRVNDGFLFRELFNAFKEWMRECNLRFAEDQDVNFALQPGLVAVVKGGVLFDTPGAGTCTPVIELKTLIFRGDSSCYKDFAVEFTSYSIRLTAEMARAQKSRFADTIRVTILSARLYDSDILTTSMDLDIKDRVMNLIINNKCLGHQQEKGADSSSSSKSVTFYESDVEISKTLRALEVTIAKVKDRRDAIITKIISEHSLSIDQNELDDDISDKILLDCLPSNMVESYGKSENVLENKIINSVQQHLVGSDIELPSSLSEILDDWSDVIRMYKALSKVQLLDIVSVLTRRKIILVDLTMVEPVITVHHETPVQWNEIFLVDCKIIVKTKDVGKIRCYRLTKKASKVLKTSSRLVSVPSDVNPDDYTWNDIIEDVRLFKVILESKDGKGFEEEFKQQLRTWFSKALYDNGMVSMELLSYLVNAGPEEEEKPSDIQLGGEDALIPIVNEDIDEFAEFLDENEDILEMFTQKPDKELDYDSDSSEGSVGEIPIMKDQLADLHQVVSSLEKYGSVKCSGLKLFNSFVKKADKDYQGLFVTPGTLIVKAKVKNSLYTAMQLFLGGAVTDEKYNDQDIPDEL